MTLTSTPSPSTVPVLSQFGYAANLLNVPFLDDGGVGITPNTTSVLYNTNGVCGNLTGDTYYLAGGSPSFSSKTITQKAQPGLDAATADTRFSFMGLTNAFLRFHAIGSQFCPGAGAPMCNGPNLQASWMMSNKVPAPSGKTRKIDMIGVDLYWFVIGQCQNIYGSNCNLTLSNVYDINLPLRR
jgi:hypothetical protein